MRNFTVLLVFVFWFSMNSFAQIKVMDENKKDKVEQRMLALVKKLPEVKSFFKHCPKENEPAIDVARTPDKSYNYYWFKIGISNFDMYRTTYDLMINPKTERIYYMDFMDISGEHDLPIETWRKWRSTPDFKKTHTFKHNKLIVINTYDKKKSNSAKKGKRI